MPNPHTSHLHALYFLFLLFMDIQHFGSNWPLIFDCCWNIPEDLIAEKIDQKYNIFGNISKMSYTLPELPYHKDAFGKLITAETFEYHYGKHHQTYINNLNSLVKGTDWEHKSLDQIVASCKDTKIFNNAAQHWNHTFYWHCITPNKTEPEGKLKELIVNKWGSVDEFLKDFSAQAVANFGSGWTWLAKQNDDIAIFNTSNAGNPLTNNYVPLLTVDVWEHAYYIDYRNARATYLQNFNGIINWKFVSQNFENGKVGLKF